jgi:amino acid adenylation domain-containing protein
VSHTAQLSRGQHVEADLTAPRRATSAEEALWRITQIWRTEALLVDAFMWRITGALDQERLMLALSRLVASQPALRSIHRADRTSGELTILPGDRRAPVVEVSDFRLLPAEERERAALDHVAERVATPFALEREPPARFFLGRVGDDSAILAVVFHHIASDEQSARVLVSELSDYYNDPEKEVVGSGPVATPPPDDPSDADLAWWSERLRSIQTADVPRRPLSSDPAGPGRCVRSPVSVDQESLARLLQYGRTLGASDFATMLAVWAATLSRVWDATTVTVGIPLTKRRTSSDWGAVGYFLNPLPVPIDLGKDRELAETLTATRRSLLDVLRHSTVSVGQLKELAATGHGYLDAPFDAWFAVEDARAVALPLQDLHCEPIDTPPGAAKFPLAMFVDEAANSSVWTIEADSKVVDRAEVQELSASIVHQVAQWTGQFSGGSPQPARAEPESGLGGLDRWFWDQARRTPAAVALECGDLAITYEELAARVDEVRAELEGCGVRPGDRVALLLRRGPTAIAAVLAVLRAGAAYVALDRADPDTRARRMLDRSGARTLVTDDTERAQALAGDRQLLVASDWPTRLSLSAPGDSTSRRACERSTDGAAYMTFTSGSSGEPKGILMPHSAVSNVIAWQKRRYGPKPSGYRVMQFAPLAFDNSALEVFGTFAIGGTLILIDDATRADLAALPAYIVRHRVERAFLPAPLVRLVSEGLRRFAPEDVSLQEVISGSEQLVATSEMRTLFQSLPTARLYNEYGPSETHVCSWFGASTDTATWEDWMPIGQAIDGAEIYCVGEDGAAPDEDELGELYIGGAGLAWGYAGDPRQTAARFVPDFASGKSGARLYRSGDLAEVRRDGTIVYRGRGDRQVQIRGHRVELGEVETALSACGGVGGAAVISVGADRAETELVAYATPRDGAALAAADLRRELGQRLPAHMVPVQVHILPDIPLTRNGKTDYAALEERSGSAQAPAGDDGGTRKRVLEEMATILGVASVPDDADFFELGGDSLRLVRLLWAVEEIGGSTMPAEAFLSRPTAGGILDWLAANREE